MILILQYYPLIKLGFKGILTEKRNLQRLINMAKQKNPILRGAINQFST